MVYFGLLLGLLAAVGGVLYRTRLNRVIRSERAPLTDELLRQIETSGYIELEEPLDLEQIREEEARFLDEYRWEEPDDL